MLVDNFIALINNSCKLLLFHLQMKFFVWLSLKNVIIVARNSGIKEYLWWLRSPRWLIQKIYPKIVSLFSIGLVLIMKHQAIINR